MLVNMTNKVEVKLSVEDLQRMLTTAQEIRRTGDPNTRIVTQQLPNGLDLEIHAGDAPQPAQRVAPARDAHGNTWG